MKGAFTYPRDLTGDKDFFIYLSKNEFNNLKNNELLTGEIVDYMKNEFFQMRLLYISEQSDYCLLNKNFDFCINSYVVNLIEKHGRYGGRLGNYKYDIFILEKLNGEYKKDYKKFNWLFITKGKTKEEIKELLDCKYPFIF